MPLEIIMLLLGIVSSTTLIISALSIHRKRLLVFVIATTALVGLQYGLVGSEVGLAACVLGLSRNMLVFVSLRYGWLNHWLFIPFFVSLHIAAFFAFTEWNNLTWISFIPVVGGCLGVLAVFFKNVIYTKAMFIGLGAIWMIYEFSLTLYGQMIGEGLTLIANIFAFFVLLNAHRKGVPEEQIEDLDVRIIGTITTSIPIIQSSVEDAITNTIKVIRHDNIEEKTKKHDHENKN